MIPLLSFLIHFTLSLRAAEQKPTIVAISIGSDKTVEEMGKKAFDRLAACGYQINNVNATDSKSLKSGLSLVDKSENSFVWLVSHGGILENSRILPGDDVTGDKAKKPIIPGQQGFHLLKDRTSGVAMDGDTAMKSIGDALPGAQVYLSSCYSGACPLKSSIGLATACAPDKKCYASDEHPGMLVDLLCSAIGDCVEWRKADRDGDGIITSAELNRYWGSRLGYKITQLTVAVDDLENARGKCEGMNGEFKYEKGQSGEVIVYPNVDKEKEKLSYSIDYFLEKFGYPREPQERRNFPATTVPLEESEFSLNLPSRPLMKTGAEPAKKWLEEHGSALRVRGKPIAYEVKYTPVYVVECHLREVPNLEKKDETIERPKARSLKLFSDRCKVERAPAPHAAPSGSGAHAPTEP